MITPSPVFKENLAQLPAIDGVASITLANANGENVATIENAPGKQGSLAVYQYLFQQFGALNAEAATHGLAIFGEHTADAQARPGAHPNIDRLFAVIDSGETLSITVTPA